MSRLTNKEWSRQMRAKIEAMERESLETTGLTLKQRREKRDEENFAALDRLAKILAKVNVVITAESQYLARGSPEHIRALPVFMAELEEDYPEDIKVLMLRELATKEAARYRPTLLQALRSSSGRSDEYRFRLAVAIDAMSTPGDLGEIIALATDRGLGMCRLAFIRRIARSRSPLAARALEELKTDPDLYAEVAAKFESKAKYRARAGK